MPRANDALSGDTKTFESRCAALMVLHSPNEKPFAAVMMLVSAGVSARGRLVRAAARSAGSGSETPPQAARTNEAASATRRSVGITEPSGMDGWGVVLAKP